MVSDRETAMAAGLDAFLTKPIDSTKLRHTLAKLVKRRQRA
jgi:CheY-like chemotaxis protein